MAGNLSPEPQRMSFQLESSPPTSSQAPPQNGPQEQECAPLVDPLPEAPAARVRVTWSACPLFTAGSAQASWTVLGVQGSLGSPLTPVSPPAGCGGFVEGDLVLSSQIKQVSLFLFTCPGPLSDGCSSLCCFLPLLGPQPSLGIFCCLFSQLVVFDYLRPHGL